MNIADFRKSLRAVAAHLDSLGLLQQQKPCLSLRPSIEFLRAVRDDLPYSQLFLVGLEHGDYNFLLCDSSYLQFALDERDGESTLRYAFLPNPIEVESYEDFLRSNGIDVEEVGSEFLEYYEDFARSQPVVHRVPTIRYELDRRSYAELRHPCAHFHLGTHGENRWPVARVLTPLAFSLHIAKMFYGSAWARHFDSSSGINPLDDRLSEEKLHCAELSESYFSARERRHLFFG